MDMLSEILRTSTNNVSGNCKGENGLHYLTELENKKINLHPVNYNNRN